MYTVHAEFNNVFVVAKIYFSVYCDFDNLVLLRFGFLNTNSSFCFDFKIMTTTLDSVS